MKDTQLLKKLEDYSKDRKGEIAELTAEAAKFVKSHLFGTEDSWMPISEGLPPMGVPLIVTIYDTINSRRELRWPVFYQHSLYRDEWGFYQYGSEDYKLDPEMSEVLAWQQYPEIWEGER